MPELPLDFRLFRYALVSAEHGSFRRAAAALNIQQSTVSRGVRSLEHRVGAELFERGHAGIQPTPAGVRFLEEASQGFDHLQRAMQRIGALQRGEHGDLTVGVSVPFALLGQLFKRYRAEYGGVSVEIVESTSGANWTLVQQRKVDVAFVAKSRAHGPMIPSLHLWDERLFAALPGSHPLAGESRLSLEELRSERFILGAGGLGPDLEEYLVTRIARWDVKPRVQLHSVGQCNLINMVAMGFGVTIVIGRPPSATCDGFALVPLTGRNVVSLHAIWMESNPNPALKGLLENLRGLGSARSGEMAR